MINEFDPAHLYWLLPLAGAILGVVFSLFWELPISFEIPMPLNFTLLLLLLWSIGMPHYVKHGIGESAQGGFIRGGEHYVYEYDRFKRDRDDGATPYHRISADRWWWLLFAEASLLYFLLVLIGFLATQWAREGIKRGVKALRGQRPFGVGGKGSEVQDFPRKPANRGRSRWILPIFRWRPPLLFRTRLVRYPAVVILMFWLCGWALGWCGAAREIARGGPLLKQLFLLGWLGVWTVVGLANLWVLWVLLRGPRNWSD